MIATFKWPKKHGTRDLQQNFGVFFTSIHIVSAGEILNCLFSLVSSWIVPCSRPTRAKLFKNFNLLVKQCSIYHSGNLPMYPSPNPTFCLKCKRRVREGVGEEFLKTLYWSSLYMSIFREFKLHVYGKRQTSQNRK